MDPQSEYAKELTSIAEKAMEEEEGIDTNYITVQTIVQDPPYAIRIRFQSAKSLSGAQVYSCGDLADTGTITFFEPHPDIYNIYNYHLGIYDNYLPENREKYSKNLANIPESSGWGKDYTYNIQGNSIELTDPETNDIMYVLPDYKVIKVESRTATITEKINSKYAFAQQLLPAGEEKPYVVIDAEETKESGLTMDVYFDDGQLFLLYMEDETQDMYDVSISHTLRYYSEERAVRGNFNE